MPKKRERVLCVIPAESIAAYYQKGEVKERYYNPDNIFTTIHIITFTDPKTPLPFHLAQYSCGNANVVIHKVGVPRLLDFLSYRKKILDIIGKIKPDVIRGFSPRLAGYCAVYAGKQLNIPVVVSIHTNEDKDTRYDLWKNRQFLRLVKSFGFKCITEKYALKRADRIICAYEFPVEYAVRNGADPEKIDVIYNHVDTRRFSSVRRQGTRKQWKILCVGNLSKIKNQQCLIRALPMIDEKAMLVLVGGGSEYPHLVDLAKTLGVENRVEFVRSVPHKEIDRYYRDADIFALPIKAGGVAIPVLEAMASGLPVVVPKPKWEAKPEFVEDLGVVVENTPEGFAQGINRLIRDEQLYKRLSVEGRKKALSVDKTVMERKEAAVYFSLLKWAH